MKPNNEKCKGINANLTKVLQNVQESENGTINDTFTKRK